MLNFPSSPSAAAAASHLQLITRSRSWQPGVGPVVPMMQQYPSNLAYQHHFLLSSNKAAQFAPSSLTATMSMQFPQPTQQAYYQQYWTPSPSSHSSGCSNSASITPTKSTTFSAYNSSEDVQAQSQTNSQLNDLATVDMLQQQRRMTVAFDLFDRNTRSQVHSLYPRSGDNDVR